MWREYACEFKEMGRVFLSIGLFISAIAVPLVLGSWVFAWTETTWLAIAASILIGVIYSPLVMVCIYRISR